MSQPRIHSHLRLTAALCLLALNTAPALAAKQSGELWENSTTMENAAGRMALGTQRECHPLNWSDPEKFELVDEGGCSNRNLVRLADSYSWEFSCDDGRHGKARVRKLGRERMESEFTMDTAEGHFVLHIQSRRVGFCAHAGAGE